MLPQSLAGRVAFVALATLSLSASLKLPAASASTISLAPTTVPVAEGGAPYSQTFTASGGTAPYTYSLSSGMVPTGLSLSSSGVLSGTPSVGGAFYFTVEATDNSTNGGPYSGTVEYSLCINEPSPALAPENPPPATVASAYSQAFTACGGTGPYTYVLSSGALPAGLSLDASTGLVSGMPTAGGSFDFMITAIDSATASDHQSYSLTVNAPTITLAPTTLPVGSTTGAFDEIITASGGVSPYSFGVTSGSLPAGLSLASNGLLSGTPTASGTFHVTIGASDSSTGTGPFVGSASFTLIVSAPTMIPPSVLTSTLPQPPSQPVLLNDSLARDAHGIAALLKLAWPTTSDPPEPIQFEIARNGEAPLMADFSASDATPLFGAGSYVLRAYDQAGTLIASLDATATLRPRPQIQASIPAWAWQMLTWRSRTAETAGPRPRTAPLHLSGWYWAWSRWRLNPYILSA